MLMNYFIKRVNSYTLDFDADEISEIEITQPLRLDSLTTIK